MPTSEHLTDVCLASLIDREHRVVGCVCDHHLPGQEWVDHAIVSHDAGVTCRPHASPADVVRDVAAFARLHGLSLRIGSENGRAVIELRRLT